MNTHLVSRIATRLCVAAAICIAGCFSTGMAPPPARTATPTSDVVSTRPWFDSGTMNPEVPYPAAIIGHEVGAEAVRYDALENYLHVLADASPYVTVTPYAETHEGRRLYYLTITSERNHARLDRIKSDNAKLADPRKGDIAIDDMPAVAWMAYTIHGDELSGTDASMLLAYRLAAGTDDLAKRMRDELVIHIDPLENADGRERYLAQLQSLQGKVGNTDYQSMQHSGLWAAGRGNHYLFDLNRDWLALVQPETRGRVRAILGWNPHLLVDAHEMGGLDTFLFDPPREPINAYVSTQNERWRTKFSTDQAAAFDTHGWSYYTQEWYEEWYPGYTNAWANVLGTIGILYEQAGVSAASLKHATGDVLTYRSAVHHQYVSSMANLETLLANRRDVLADYRDDRRWAVSQNGELDGMFVLVPSVDQTRFDMLTDVLNRQGIEMTVATKAFEGSDVRDTAGATHDTQALPAGSVIVRSNQPHRRLMHAMLDFDPRMNDAFLVEERRELENRRGSRLYDVTAWSLPMAFGLESYWVSGTTGLTEAAWSATVPGSQVPPVGAYGYVIDGSNLDVYRAIVRLLDHECNVRVASKPFTLAGTSYPRGSVLLRGHENPGDLEQVLRGVVADLTLEIRSADTALSGNGWDLGGQRFHLLEQPRVAIASQWPTSTTSFGANWFALDAQLGLRVSPVNIQSLGRMDLRAYNVLIIPNAFGSALGAVLDEGARNRLRQWMRNGGTLIAHGGSAAFLARDGGLSDVRLRRNVLEKLDAYSEATRHEVNARDITVDPEVVWGTGLVADDTNAPAESQPEAGASAKKPKTKPKAKLDKEARKRRDDWQRLFSPSGVIARAILNQEHWLTFGVPEQLPVRLSGSSVFMSQHPTATPVRLDAGPEMRLGGLLWPEARQRLGNSAYATVEGVGNGQLILFASDPMFRGFFSGSARLGYNAVILGPGLGADQAIPW